jgi:hypothetical protein
MTRFKTRVAAAMLARVAGTASEATITFGNYASSNVSDSLSQLEAVSDEVAGGFLVTVTHVVPSNGSLNLVAFDLGTAVFASGNVTNVRDNGAAMTLASPCPSQGGGPAIGSYCFGTSVPLGGNDNRLNPCDPTPSVVRLPAAA